MKKFSLLLAVVMMLVFSCSAALAAAPEDIKQSVARVYVEVVESIYEAQTKELLDRTVSGGHGTGFAIGKPGEPVKYFITNEHVASPDETYSTSATITDSETGEVYSIPIIVETDYTYYLIFSDFDHKVPAEFVSTSDRADLGMLMLVEPTTLRKAAVIRPFEKLKETEELWACGYPYVAEYENEGQYYSGFDQMMLSKGEAGTVKDHGITQRGQLIIHTIPSTAGNSGGPVVDKNGRVVGVHSHTYNDDGEHSAFKGAVSSNELIRFLNVEGVEYTTEGGDLDMVLLVGIAVAAVLAIVVVVLLISRKKGGSAPKKGFELVGTAGVHSGKTYTITGEAISLGRNTAKCKIAYGKDVGGVSALHCELKAVAGGVQVTDLGSSYGTWVDKMKLTANTPVVMQPGQTLSLGSKQQAFMLRK